MRKSDKPQLGHLERFEKGIYDLSGIYRKHTNYIAAKFKVSRQEIEIIQYIILNDKRKMRDLGDHFHIKLSTLTSIIDKIERQGFLRRKNSKADRRSVFLAGTIKGKKLYTAYSQYLEVASQLAERNMEREDFELFINGLGASSHSHSHSQAMSQLEEGLLSFNGSIRELNIIVEESLEVSTHEMKLIQHLALNGAQKMNSISSYFDFKLSTFTSVIDKAEEKGLLKRVKSKTDRRVIFLDITEKSRRIHKKYQKALATWTANIEDKMSPKGMKKFLSSLEAFNEQA